MPFYYLEVTRGIQTGTRFPLADGASSIGRSSQNTIVLDSGEKSVSGHHAIVYKSPERVFLQDLQSTNGTFVNNVLTSEQDLQPGDEIGFGKAGPRLKLVVSETELPTTATRDTSKVTTSIKTIEDEAPPRPSPYASSDSTSKEDLNTLTRIKQDAPQRKQGFGGPSVTMEMEQKLLAKSLSAADMQKLMRDEKRVERLVERGNLGSTQVSMLRMAQGAARKSHKQWVVVATVLVSVAVALGGVAIFFFIKAAQYRALLTKAQNLQGQMETVERRISAANANPEQNKQQLKMLIAELDQKNQQFSTMKSRIDQDDFGKFYADPLERTIDQVMMRFGEADYHVPREMVARVKHHIQVYSGPMRKTIAKYIARKQKYFPMIQQVFREKNLPLELAYVSMLESGFNPMAISHAGARGLWQFMPNTGRTYKLRVDDQVDERTDPLKATYAAAEYFKDLIAIFGGKSSVMLCMAAYNAGEGRLIGALRKIDDPMRNRDFWYIYHMGYLAEETNEYIPRVIALMIISENPQAYGFSGAEAIGEDLERADDFVEVKTSRVQQDR